MLAGLKILNCQFPDTCHKHKAADSFSDLLLPSSLAGIWVKLCSNTLNMQELDVAARAFILILIKTHTSSPTGPVQRRAGCTARSRKLTLFRQLFKVLMQARNQINVEQHTPQFHLRGRLQCNSLQGGSGVTMLDDNGEPLIQSGPQQQLTSWSMGQWTLKGENGRH